MIKRHTLQLMAHTYAKLYGIPSTGLRFFTVYGPAGRPDMAYFSFTDKLVRGEKIKIFNYGDCYRDFTYIDDIVTGILAVMQKAPEQNEKGVRYKVYNNAVAGIGYVGLTMAVLLAQHNKVVAVDVVEDKTRLVNKGKSPIADEDIEAYLAEKELDLTATTDAEKAYKDADFVIVAAPTNVYSTNRIDVASSKRACFAHYMGY